MIKNVIITATLSLTALAILSSCGAKLSQITADKAKAEPQPLELFGGKLPGTLHLTFPSMWFPKNA